MIRRSEPVSDGHRWHLSVERSFSVVAFWTLLALALVATVLVLRQSEAEEESAMASSQEMTGVDFVGSWRSPRWVMDDVVTNGVDAAELAFVFLWYGDTDRMQSLLDHPHFRVDLASLRFGPLSVTYATDNSSKHWTLLHLAVVRNNPRAVNFLVREKGLDIDGQPRKPHECPSPLELLLTRRTDRFGTEWTQAEYVTMAKLLVKLGADGTSRAVLSNAILVGDSDLFALLLDAGANPDLVIGNGDTLLHSAIFLGMREIAELLIQHGARTDLANDNGVTARYLLEGMPGFLDQDDGHSRVPDRGSRTMGQES